MSVSPPRVTPYDNGAIFTGSGTVVNGSIKLIYPGLCDANATRGCPPSTGHGHQCNLAVALPSDPTDPLATNWSKPSGNPFATNAGRDPSAAWQTPIGEWQFTTYLGDLFGTMDWISFYPVAEKFGGWGGECPSFFPLPRQVSPAGAGATNYTHVYKHSTGNRDWMILGRYDPPSKPRQPGTWTALAPPQMIDAGGLYASKDFTTADGRRVTTGFGHCPGSAGGMVLPREVTFSAELDQLLFTPLPELATLRSPTALANLSSTQLQPNAPLKLVSSNQTEVIVEFALPKATDSPVIFGVNVSGGLEFFVNFTGNLTDVEVSQSNGHNHAASGPPLRLLAADTSITMRVFVDDVYVECYFMEGRRVITWGKTEKRQSASSDDDDGLAISAYANAPMELKSAVAWQLGSIWVGLEDVLS